MTDNADTPVTGNEDTDNLLATSTSGEPLVTVGTIVAITTAIIAVLVSFTVPINDAQQTAIIGMVAVIAPFIVAFFGRSRVFSPRTVVRLLREQAQRGRTY